MTTVVINDLVADQRHVVTFARPTDFQRADAYWETEDKLLVGLQHTVQFAGRKRWCDLTPNNYRFLIMNNLSKVSALSLEEQNDPKNEVMMSMTLLLTAFIRCLELRTESTVELMKLIRLADHEVLYDFSASINLHIDGKKAPKKKLRVIVNNE